MLLRLAASLLVSRSAFPAVCHVRACSEADAEAYGESTAGYERSEMAPAQIDQLVSRGYVVLDGAFDAEEAAGLEMCLTLLDDSASLSPEPPGSGRDDSIRFVDEGSAMISVEVALHLSHPARPLLCVVYFLCMSLARPTRPIRPLQALCTLSARALLPLHTLCTRSARALHPPGGDTPAEGLRRDAAGAIRGHTLRGRR